MIYFIFPVLPKISLIVTDDVTNGQEMVSNLLIKPNAALHHVRKKVLRARFCVHSKKKKKESSKPGFTCSSTA